MVGCDDLICCGREDKIVRMRGDDDTRRVNHLQCTVRRVIAVDILGTNVHRKELGPEEAFHAREISLAAFVRRSDVAVDGIRGNVIMCVDQDGVTRDARDLCVSNRFGARRLSHDWKDKRGKKDGGSERVKSAQRRSFQNGLS